MPREKDGQVPAECKSQEAYLHRLQDCVDRQKCGEDGDLTLHSEQWSLLSFSRFFVKLIPWVTTSGAGLTSWEYRPKTSGIPK